MRIRFRVHQKEFKLHLEYCEISFIEYVAIEVIQKIKKNLYFVQ